MRIQRTLWVSAVLLVAAGLVAGWAFSNPPSPKDQRFLVMAPHTKEECLKTLDETQAFSKELLAKIDWGCMAGDHTAYVVLTAKDEDAVKKMLPADWTKARIVKVNKFTPEEIVSFHKK